MENHQAHQLLYNILNLTLYKKPEGDKMSQMFDYINVDLPSGDLTSLLKITMFIIQWENSLFLWLCSMAMFHDQREIPSDHIH